MGSGTNGTQEHYHSGEQLCPLKTVLADPSVRQQKQKQGKMLDLGLTRLNLYTYFP